uniref:F-box domain-containing protein n=1 Tax=Steinernema glaseri TaxID=37863 RepID=A0A1I8A4N7_9BILA
MNRIPLDFVERVVNQLSYDDFYQSGYVQGYYRSFQYGMDNSRRHAAAFSRLSRPWPKVVASQPRECHLFVCSDEYGIHEIEDDEDEGRTTCGRLVNIETWKRREHVVREISFGDKRHCAKVIESGGVDAIMHLTKKVDTLRVDFVRVLAKWYSNMCRNHKESQSENLFEGFVKAVASHAGYQDRQESEEDIAARLEYLNVFRKMAEGLVAFLEYPDIEVRQNVAWAFSHLSGGSEKPRRKLPHEVGALDSLVKAFEEDNDDLVTATLRVLGHVGYECDEMIQMLITKGYFKNHIKRFLLCGRPSVVEEALFLVVSILTGTSDQIDYMLGLDVLPLILNFFATGDIQDQFEASRCILNVTKRGSPEQIMKLMESGLGPIADGLRREWDIETVTNIVSAIDRIFTTYREVFSQSYSAVLSDFKDSGCLELVEKGYEQHVKLDERAEKLIYRKVLRIVKNHFNEDHDYGDEEHDKEEVKPGCVIHSEL